jgi:hypothetical protein
LGRNLEELVRDFNGNHGPNDLNVLFLNYIGYKNESNLEVALKSQHINLQAKLNYLNTLLKIESKKDKFLFDTETHVRNIHLMFGF